MSSGIWKICQNTNSNEVYNQTANGCGSETFAAKVLTSYCEKMIEAFDDIKDEKADYELKLDDMNEELKNLQINAREELEKILNRINELRQRELDGTITDEEREELVSKQQEYQSVLGYTNTTIKTKSDDVYSVGVKMQDSCKAKEQVAYDYADKTIEVGKPLSETEVRTGFWNKLFGKTKSDKNKKRAGEDAVKTGNELLAKLDESTKIDDSIAEKEKRYKK